MKDRNGGAGAIADAPKPAIDWAALEELAQQLGPRTRRLAAVRDLEGLQAYLPWALEVTRSPEVAALYTEAAAIVGVALSSGEVAGDVDRHGDVIDLGGAA